MRIPDVVFKSVGFIGEVTHEDSAGASADLCATGFFVCAPFASAKFSHKRWGFFVTAAHVAKELSDKPIYFLVNKRGGGLTGIEPLVKNWLVHPTDRSADVVAMPVALNREADITCVAEKDLAGPSDFVGEEIGVGDEVFITGLFTAVPGVSRVMPIVRHGNIAMLPEEQIQTEMGYADVHLVEARSIGGLSGSPVFVRTESEGGFAHSGIRLLGLMHGHWDIKESELNKPTIAHDRRGVNLGIGIVVPAVKIMEIINSPVVMEWRKEMEEKLERDSVPRTDLGRSKNRTVAEDMESFTKEDFETALKKATRKVGSKTQ